MLINSMENTIKLYSGDSRAEIRFYEHVKRSKSHSHFFFVSIYVQAILCLECVFDRVSESIVVHYFVDSSSDVINCWFYLLDDPVQCRLILVVVVGGLRAMEAL